MARKNDLMLPPMVRYPTLSLVYIALVAGCSTSSGILPSGPDTYTVSETRAPIRGGGMEAQRIAMTEANSFCERQNRVFVPLSLGQSGDLTNQFGPTGYTATFQCRSSADVAKPKSDIQQSDSTTAPAAQSSPQGVSDTTLDWLSTVQLLPGEKRGELNSDEDMVYFVSEHYLTTPEGTRIAFVHKETKLPNPKFGYISERETWEIDCAQRKSRIRAATSFAKRNLEGSIIYTDKWVGDWDYDAPNTMGEGLDSMVCTTSRPPALINGKRSKQKQIHKPDII